MGVTVLGIQHNFYPRSPCGERPDVSVVEYKKAKISIHALLAESDLDYKGICVQNLEFLSTLSLRRATLGYIATTRTLFDFYPRSPCGERRNSFGKRTFRLQFLSTLSLRRATMQGNPKLKDMLISIHALLAESDTQTQKTPHFTSYFYPRSPCGERQGLTARANVQHHFYPRSPCGERPYMG